MDRTESVNGADFGVLSTVSNRFSRSPWWWTVGLAGAGGSMFLAWLGIRHGAWRHGPLNGWFESVFPVSALAAVFGLVALASVVLAVWQRHRLAGPSARLVGEIPGWRRMLTGVAWLGCALCALACLVAVLNVHWSRGTDWPWPVAGRLPLALAGIGGMLLGGACAAWLAIRGQVAWRGADAIRTECALMAQLLALVITGGVLWAKRDGTWMAILLSLYLGQLLALAVVAPLAWPSLRAAATMTHAAPRKAKKV